MAQRLSIVLVLVLATTLPAQGDSRDRARAQNELGGKALAQGCLEKAMRHFAAALEQVPEAEVLRRNYTAAAAAALRRALAGGRPGAGEALCRRAEKVLGPHPWFGTMLGSLLAGQGRRVQAARVLERTGKLAGGHHALVVLARMRRDQGELEEACRHLRRALPRLESTLRGRVAAWEKLWRTDLVLRGRKRRLQVHPLRIYLPDGADPARAARLQKLCRRGCAAAERTTGLRVRENVEVVFSTRSELRSLGGPGWASGLYYDGVVRVIHQAGGEDRMEAILAHEFTHALLARLGSGIPAWLHEGMAQLAEGRDPREAIDHLRRAGGRLLPLSGLTASFTRLGNADRAARAYAQSLALTWHLTQKGRGGCRSLLLCLRGEEEGRWSERIAHWAGAPVAEMLGDLARTHRLQPPPALASPGR